MSFYQLLTLLISLTDKRMGRGKFLRLYKFFFFTQFTAKRVDYGGFVIISYKPNLNDKKLTSSYFQHGKRFTHTLQRHRPKLDIPQRRPSKIGKSHHTINCLRFEQITQIC